ncbi:MAG: DUF4101 domain-containing protein [Chloroflexaceae bacterium]|nr:DUF4101 domain-containing protein [Chloroflexaceae bacterium]
MLEERKGIDGTGDDRSGLSIDDFLRFIQQIRTHLTVKEQEDLFEAEAQRPSAVASYLAVYALIARGFRDRNPNLVVRAQSLLQRLGRRQDVSIEQGICALLLGQTEAAHRALQQSREQETLTFIREHSQGSPDWLPGLCLYTERWLQTEVFAHFRDLAGKTASLSAYFADESLQYSLEELAAREQQQESMPAVVGMGAATVRQLGRQGSRSQLRYGQSVASQVAGYDRPRLVALAGGTATQTHPASHRESPVVSPTERGSQGQPGSLSESRILAPGEPQTLPTVRERRSPEGRLDAKKSEARSRRRLWLGLVGVLSVGVVGSFAYRVWRPQPQLEISLNESVIAIPVLEEELPRATGLQMTQAQAQSVISAWLGAKQKALGETYQTEALQAVLAPSLLPQWQEQALSLKGSNAYRKFQHQVDIRAVNLDARRSQAVVEAAVQESAKHYQGGELAPGQSYDETLLVRYQLVFQDRGWLIQSIQVVRSL